MGRRERNEPGRAAPEDAIHALHRVLALGLGALAGLLFVVRGPADEQRPSEASAVGREADLSRADLDAAIARLATWIDGRSRAPHTPLATNQRLLALGRAALDEDLALVTASLERLTTAGAAGSVPASVQAGVEPSAARSPPGSDDERDGSATATLAILLEAGTPLDRELPLAGGPARLGRLLELALPAASARARADDPWALDVLSFALLAGLSSWRESLARRVHASLLALEHDARRLDAEPGDADGLDSGATLGSGQLAASVFRALAVLAEPDLDQRGLRYLNALLRQQHAARDARRQRLAAARGVAERVALQARGLEALGQLEQALFGAHLAFRGDRAALAPRIASGMRGAAAELLELLDALEHARAFDVEQGVKAPAELVPAAAHALRGLRAARVAL